MKTILLVCLSFVLINTAKAQDTTVTWKTSGFTSLNANSVSHTNWAGGGDNIVGATALFNLSWKYKKRKHLWIGLIDLGYGLVKEKDVSLRKNEDKIDLDLKYAHRIKNKFYYSFLLNAKSQFAPGYDYPNDTISISDFLAPAYITLSAGIDYMPDEYLSIFISPTTFKFTVVKDQHLADLDKFGVAPAQYDANGNRRVAGKKLRTEFGALISIRFQKDIITNVNFFSRLNLFNDYTDENKSKRTNIDVNWETRFNIKINSFLNATLFTHLVYDDNVTIFQYKEINGVNTLVGKGPRLQFKEVSGLGLSYRF